MKISGSKVIILASRVIRSSYEQSRLGIGINVQRVVLISISTEGGGGDDKKRKNLPYIFMCSSISLDYP